MKNLNYLRDFLSRTDWTIDFEKEYDETFCVFVKMGAYLLNAYEIIKLEENDCRFYVNQYESYFFVDK